MKFRLQTHIFFFIKKTCTKHNTCHDTIDLDLHVFGRMQRDFKGEESGSKAENASKFLIKTTYAKTRHLKTKISKLV